MDELTITRNGKTVTLYLQDRCSFTVTRRAGSSGYRIKSMVGVLIQLGEKESIVRAKGARANEKVRTDSLRPEKWKNALTEQFLEAFAG